MYKLKKYILKKIKERGYLLSKLQARNGNEGNPLYYLAGFFIQGGYNGSLLQIGANDGVTNDPVREIIFDFKIPSLLIEPQPHIFQELKAAYSDAPNVRFENCAIDVKDGFKDLFFIDPAVKEYPAWATGIASFEMNTLLKHRRVLPKLEDNIRKIAVPTYTLNSLMQKHKINRIFILQLDAEGYDYELLKCITTLENLPKLIQYEHKHLSFPDQLSCRAFLSGLGYTFITGSEDTMAINEDQVV